MALRTTQTSRRVAIEPDSANIRVTQVARRVAVEPDAASVRVTQVARRVAIAWSNGSFALDAYIESPVVSGNFAVSALVLLPASGSFAASSLLRRNQIGSFDLSAYIVQSIAGNFSASALLARSVSGSFSASSVVAKTASGAFGLSSFVAGGSVTQTGSFDLSASTVLTVGGSFSLSALILKTQYARGTWQYFDNFNRTVASGLGNGWAHSWGGDTYIPQGAVSVNGSYAVATPKQYEGFVNDTILVSEEMVVQFDFWVQAVASQTYWTTYYYSEFSRLWVDVSRLGVPTSSPFEARVRVAYCPTGSETYELGLINLTESTWYTLKAEQLGSYSGGGYARVKVWKRGDPEPEEWLATSTSSSPITVYQFPVSVEIDSSETEEGRLDNFLVLTASQTPPTADAVIVATLTGSFGLSSFVNVPVTGSFTASAYLAGALSLSALIGRTATGTFGLSAYVRPPVFTVKSEVRPGGAAFPAVLAREEDEIAIVIHGATGYWRDVTTNTIFQRTEFVSQVNGQPGTCRIVLLDRNWSLAGEFVTGNSIYVRINNLTVWAGYITRIKRIYPFDAYSPDERMIEIQGVDVNILFQKRIVMNKRDMTDGEGPTFGWYTHDTYALRSLLDNYLDIGADSLDTHSGIRSVGRINENQNAAPIKPGAPWSDSMRLIGSLLSPIWYINPDRMVVWADVDVEDAPYAISDNPTGDEIGCANLTVSEDASELINDVLLVGAGNGSDRAVYRRLESTSSIETHNRSQFGTMVGGIYKQESIDRIASSYINGAPSSRRGHKNDKVSITCTVFTHGLRAGHKVHLSSDVWGYSDVIPIRQLRLRWLTPGLAQYDLTLTHELDTTWSFFDPYVVKAPPIDGNEPGPKPVPDPIPIGGKPKPPPPPGTVDNRWQFFVESGQSSDPDNFEDHNLTDYFYNKFGYFVFNDLSHEGQPYYLDTFYRNQLGNPWGHASDGVHIWSQIGSEGHGYVEDYRGVMRVDPNGLDYSKYFEEKTNPGGPWCSDYWSVNWTFWSDWVTTSPDIRNYWFRIGIVHADTGETFWFIFSWNGYGEGTICDQEGNCVPVTIDPDDENTGGFTFCRGKTCPGCETSSSTKCRSTCITINGIEMCGTTCTGSNCPDDCQCIHDGDCNGECNCPGGGCGGGCGGNGIGDVAFPNDVDGGWGSPWIDPGTPYEASGFVYVQDGVATIQEDSENDPDGSPGRWDSEQGLPLGGPVTGGIDITFAFTPTPSPGGHYTFNLYLSTLYGDNSVGFQAWVCFAVSSDSPGSLGVYFVSEDFSHTFEPWTSDTWTDGAVSGWSGNLLHAHVMMGEAGIYGNIWKDGESEPSGWQASMSAGSLAVTPYEYLVFQIYDGMFAMPSLTVGGGGGAGYRFDNFNRTVADGWGTSDTGAVWALNTAGGIQFSVDGSSALAVFPQNTIGLAGSEMTTMTGPWTADTFTLTSRFQITLASKVLAVNFRVKNTATGAFCEAFAGPWINRIGVQNDDADTNNSWVDAALSMPDGWYNFKWSVSPTETKLKMWADGSAEPDWMVTSPSWAVAQDKLYVTPQGGWHTSGGSASVAIDYIDFDYAVDGNGNPKPCYKDCSGSTGAITDTFTRTIAGGWGTSDAGIAWDSLAGSGVDGLRGWIDATNHSIKQHQMDLSNVGTDISFTSRFVPWQGTSDALAGISFWVLGTGGHDVLMHLGMDGNLMVNDYFASESTSTAIGITPDTEHNWKIQITTNGFSVKVWSAASSEPALWTKTLTPISGMNGVLTAILLGVSGEPGGTSRGYFDNLDISGVPGCVNVYPDPDDDDKIPDTGYVCEDIAGGGSSTLTTSRPYQIGSVTLWVNGLLQTDYAIPGGTSIPLGFSTDASDSIKVCYHIAGGGGGEPIVGGPVRT